ncbi:MAG TPA: DUF4215 domain-containing protein, partial [Planctomycetes bacterium]|nr:DUF4215 domain-containing protein [Planctomycetota bacterium]
MVEGEPGYEACDDGNRIDGDGCNADCSFAACGDARLDRGEGCDDVNHDACTNGCELARCGDGVIRRDLGVDDEGYENCDDNNGVHTDACTNLCSLARCGDGVTRDDVINFGAGWEECDDGNIVNDDGCRRNCRFSAIADADGYIWDPYSPYQYLLNGTLDAWDGFGILRVNNVPYRGGILSVDWDARVYTAQEVELAGFQVLRRFYVAHPGDDADLRNFGRFFLRVRNPSELPRSVNLHFYGNLGSDSDTELVSSSDGDQQLSVDDDWMVSDDADAHDSVPLPLV